MIYMWFTDINYYKLADEKDRDTDSILKEVYELGMGGRYHQKYYTCEMNGHKQKSFITNTNESSCLEMLEPTRVK